MSTIREATSPQPGGGHEQGRHEAGHQGDRDERSEEEDREDAGQVGPVALILGGASCLEDDILSARRLVDPAACVVIAANDAGFWWPGRLDHWVTMHVEELPERERIRAERGYSGGYVRWTRPYPAGMQERHELVDQLISGWNGSSGLLAVGVAVAKLECSHSLLCGMPMDERAHFNRKGRWEDCHRNRLGWRDRETDIRGRVRSFSGWTAEFLGVPDAEWLDQPIGTP